MMLLRRVFGLSMALALSIASLSAAQSPSVLYTWDNTGSASPNVEQWVKKFGTNNVLFDNSIPGNLRIIETGGVGATVAIGDDGNRVRESSTANGGLDLTGLSFLEYEIGHTGASPVNVQFYVQASPASTFLALGPDVAVQPGMNTYQLPLSGLTPAQIVYIRTLGVNVRDHAAQGDLIWNIQEVRSVGTPLTLRNLATHDIGTSDNGLQGAIVNFDFGAVVGSNGLANQTGLSHDAGTGSLTWTDRGGDGSAGLPSGAAVTWGNGTVYNGNGFNERTHDASNYNYVKFRLSATDPNGLGGVLPLQAFFQNGPSFASQLAGAGGIPIDGNFYELAFPLSGITQREVINWVGLNFGAHANDIQVRVDRVQYSMVPEPTALVLVGLAGIAGSCVRRRETA
jgi:hypothetical protein